MIIIRIPHAVGDLCHIPIFLFQQIHGFLLADLIDILLGCYPHAFLEKMVKAILA